MQQPPPPTRRPSPGRRPRTYASGSRSEAPRTRTREGDSSAWPRVSVVVPVYNALPFLEACLDSVLAAADEYGNAEVVVVDNGSTDGSWELVRRRYSERLTALREPDASVGGVRNRGAARADGDILAFVDADCEVGCHYLHEIADQLADPDKDATGCRYALPEAPAWVEWVWHDLHERPEDGRVDYLNAGNFAVSRRVFEAVGGFREDLASGEDAELGQRITAEGFRIWECHAVTAVHHGNPKSMASFMRKQTWHAIGMFGTFGKSRIDKPVIMLGVHLALALAGLAWIAFGTGPLLARLVLAAGVTFFVPAVTVAYRFLNGGGVQAPGRAVFLYWLYYAARTRALGVILGRRLRADAAPAGGSEAAALTKNLQRS